MMKIYIYSNKSRPKGGSAPRRRLTPDLRASPGYAPAGGSRRDVPLGGHPDSVETPSGWPPAPLSRASREAAKPGSGAGECPKRIRRHAWDSYFGSCSRVEWGVFKEVRWDAACPELNQALETRRPSIPGTNQEPSPRATVRIREGALSKTRRPRARLDNREPEAYPAGRHQRAVNGSSLRREGPHPAWQRLVWFGWVWFGFVGKG